MSRSDARSRRLRHRPSRVVPASIVAVVLLAAGALTVLVVIARLLDGAWPSQVTSAAGPVADLTWGTPAVIAAAAVVALLGLVLLLAGITLGPFRTAPLQDPAGGEVDRTDYVISTRAMARLAAAHADTVDGVDKVSTSATSRRVRVQVTTTSERTGELRDRVQQRVADALTSAGISPAPRVTTSVRTKGI